MRREFVLVLLAGAAGAGLVVLAARQPWAHAVFAPPRPLPAQDIAVTGQDSSRWPARSRWPRWPAWPVIATRSVLRRAVGVLLAVLGAGTAVAVLASLHTSAVLAAARAAALAGPLGGSTTSEASSAARCMRSSSPGRAG